MLPQRLGERRFALLRLVFQQLVVILSHSCERPYQTQPWRNRSHQQEHRSFDLIFHRMTDDTLQGVVIFEKDNNGDVLQTWFVPFPWAVDCPSHFDSPFLRPVTFMLLLIHCVPKCRAYPQSEKQLCQIAQARSALDQASVPNQFFTFSKYKSTWLYILTDANKNPATQKRVQSFAIALFSSV